MRSPRGLEARYLELLRRDLFNIQQRFYPAQLLLSVSMQTYADSVPSALRSLPGWLLGGPMGGQLRGGEPPTSGALAHPRASGAGLLRSHAGTLRLKGLELATAGSVDMMRRQAIPPIVRYLRALRSEPPTVLGVHAGTARTSLMLQASFPEAEYGALRVGGAAGELARADNSVDLVVCSFVLHTLPCDKARQLLSEVARVLKPGGRLVLLDLLQRPELEDLGLGDERGPLMAAQAALRQYISHDVQATLTDLGWELLEVVPAYLAKVIVAQKAPSAELGGLKIEADV